MTQASFSFARAVWAIPLGVAIVVGGLAVSASAQQVGPPTVAAPTVPGAQPVIPNPGVPAAQMPAAGIPAAGTPAAPGVMMQGVGGKAAQAPAAAPAATASAPDDTNPFSSVKPVDNQALKMELPAIEARLQQMQNQMSAIQQVQVALPAEALNMPSGRSHGAGAGAAAPMDEAAMELQASTFVACVNGQAMFRDTDQKPFFVDAKEANQNEAVRRIGGCKH